MPNEHIVLIIDDDKRVARMLARRIKRMGLLPEIVHDGQSGIEKTFELEPGLVLMDIRMPGMDGYTVIKTLRARNYTGLVVACSASIAAKDSDLTLKAGCDYFIGKPIDDTFEETILDLMK